MHVRHLANAAAAATLVLVMTACMTTVNHKFALPYSPVPPFPEHVHLTLNNGDTLTVRNARSVNDVIAGIRVNGTLSDSAFSVPVKDVKSISSRKVSKGRTVALLSVGLFLTLIVAGSMAATAAASSLGGY